MSTVGDVNSTARGSGARFNSGKPPLELLPMKVFERTADDPNVAQMFHLLHGFQFGHEPMALDTMLNILKPHVKECAAVFDYGRKKYAEWNWLKGMAWSVPLACAARHLLAIDSGEEYDAESGLSHWGHVMCNIVMLHTYTTTYPEGNDLPTVPQH